MIFENKDLHSSFEDTLKYYKDCFDKKVRDSIHLLSSKNSLRDACEYALTNGGKRFRPSIVLMIAKTFNTQIDVWDAALAVEYFHTSSLIADDLPCMDNDDFRRNMPSLHKKYGENVALLASYALIGAGYESILKNGELLKSEKIHPPQLCDQISIEALKIVAHNTCIDGAPGGQYLDVFPPKVMNRKVLEEILYKKTVTLFEIAFVFGWLFGGGDIAKLANVKKAAYHFGLVFQIVDDFCDLQQDLQKVSCANFPVILGNESAIEILQQELNLFNKVTVELGIHSQEMSSLIYYLIDVASNEANITLVSN